MNDEEVEQGSKDDLNTRDIIKELDTAKWWDFSMRLYIERDFQSSSANFWLSFSSNRPVQIKLSAYF